MKLIDKDIVIAKINGDLDSYDPNEITSGRYALADLRDFINTLEVKVEDELAGTFIEKACEYMCNHIDPQLTIYHEHTWKKRDEFIRDFKSAMEKLL